MELYLIYFHFNFNIFIVEIVILATYIYKVLYHIFFKVIYDHIIIRNQLCVTVSTNCLLTIALYIPINMVLCLENPI